MPIYTPDPASDSVATGQAGQPFYPEMNDAADVGGGGTTQTVGFQMKDSAGSDVAGQKMMEFAVFDDVGLSVPSAAATLGTVADGTIIAGEGSAALKVQTDANGLFQCTLTNPADTTVYVACSPTFGSPALDCTRIDSVTFSA